MKERWDNGKIGDELKKSRENYHQKNGFWPGMSVESKEKRKETMEKRYGVKHNWNGKYGERKCDKTTEETYGKSSADMLIEYTHYFNKKTDIEIIFENLLNEMNIQYQPKFRIYNENKEEFTFREYDFLIKNTKILVEVDGDYWHGNKKIFTPLSEFQKNTQKNDKIKEKFAQRNGYEIIRFWGSDIKNDIDTIKDKINKLCQK